MAASLLVYGLLGLNSDQIVRKRLVLELWAKHHCSVLLVTHDVDEALLLADRAVVLEGGRLRTELHIPLERPRRHSDPRFEQLRSALLLALGV